MRVKELMGFLQEQDQEAEVVVELVPGEQAEIIDVTEGDEGKVVIETE